MTRGLGVRGGLVESHSCGENGIVLLSEAPGSKGRSNGNKKFLFSVINVLFLLDRHWNKSPERLRRPQPWTQPKFTWTGLGAT